MYNYFMHLTYLLACGLFILSIRSLSSPTTARWGNTGGILAMSLVIIITLLSPQITHLQWIILSLFLGGGIGIISGFKVKMTSLPQMVAAFNGLGGLSSLFIAFAEILGGSKLYLENSVSSLIGAIAFSGSLIAFAKLQGIINPRSQTFLFQQFINFILGISLIGLCIAFIYYGNIHLFYVLSGIAIILGLLLVLPIGGADMPVVISVLNSYTGWAAVGIGFSLQNTLLIIVGALVGASGAILSYIMCKAMNRSLINVIFGGIKVTTTQEIADKDEDKTAHTGSPADAAYIMENANKIIIVPGYGMAVAQAQHILKEMADILHQKYGVEVKFAIHPVAGRMPGHMNVLLAEANVPYENVFEIDDINREFSTTDVVYVIGANDVTNPLAKTDSHSPIYGMPILEVEKAKTVFFVKRSLNTGYSGVDNPLFYADNTIMLYGDAKKITEEIVKDLN